VAIAGTAQVPLGEEQRIGHVGAGGLDVVGMRRAVVAAPGEAPRIALDDALGELAPALRAVAAVGAAGFRAVPGVIEVHRRSPANGGVLRRRSHGGTYFRELGRENVSE